MSLRQPSHLTQQEFNATVAAIGMPNTHVADMIGISAASMHRYRHGLAVIPKTVGLLLQLLGKNRSPELFSLFLQGQKDTTVTRRGGETRNDV